MTSRSGVIQGGSGLGILIAVIGGHLLASFMMRLGAVSRRLLGLLPVRGQFHDLCGGLPFWSVRFDSTFLI